MSVRQVVTALLTVGAAAGTTLAAAPAQAAVPTGSCYSFTVNPYGDIRPIISYERQIELTARNQGVAVTYGAQGTGLACAGSSYTVYRMLRSLPVSNVRFTSVHSVQPGTYQVALPTMPDGTMVIPERAPYYVAMMIAEDNGLRIVDDGFRHHIVVQGNPATVLAASSGYFVMQVA